MLSVHACRSLCEASLSAFTPLDLDTPGVTVLHLDPPILTMDNFMSAEECADLIAAAEATGDSHAVGSLWCGGLLQKWQVSSRDGDACNR
jgi:hypothetical protein